MAVITIQNRPILRPLIWVTALVLLAIMTLVLLTASRASDVSTGSDSIPRAAVFDPSLGPNQDLPPVWGIERSPAEASRGPNQDLPPLWDS